MDGYILDGRKLRAVRERKGYRQAQLSREANVSRSYLKEIEGRLSRPEHPNYQPTAVVVHRIANTLGVDFTEFCDPITDDEVDAA